MSERGVIGRFSRRFTMAMAFGVASFAAHVARADEPPPSGDSAVEARRQYELGSQAFSRKLYVEAAQRFEAAAALKSSAVAYYTAALAWDHAQRLERAADDYARSVAESGLDAKQTDTATERLSALEDILGTLTITAPEGWKVALDQTPDAPSSSRLHGAPGVHELRIQAPGRPLERRVVTLEAGSASSITLTDEPKPPPPEAEPPKETKPAPVFVPPPPQNEFWTTSRAIGVGVLGAGIAAFGATAILGATANDAKDSYNDAPTRAGFDHASSLETWTNVALVSGAVLAVSGVVLLVLPFGKTDHRAELRAAPGGCAVGGTF